MEAITREEKLLSGQQLEPITRKELFLAKAAGMDVQTPEPITREEIFLSQISGGGGGTIEPLSVTENGTYNPPEGVDGYSPVTVSVASSGGSDVEEQFVRMIERKPDTPVTKLPEGLTRIGSYVFYYNAGIKQISLPDGVASIGVEAFKGCTNLQEINLPDRLAEIYNDAFSGCTKLSTEYIPAGITIMGYAFYGCKSLSLLTFKGKPKNVASSAFNNCTNLLTINVPWAEGEVSGAPWGATNATINYNYTGG